MLLTQQESTLLIEKVQKEIATPQEERRLFLELESRYQPHKIENYLYDPEEMKAEYMWGAWNAIYRAKLNIGDPIMFCIRRGKGAMLDYYRKIDSKYLIKICPNCGLEVACDRRNKVCKNCGEEYTTIHKEESMSVEDFNQVFSQDDHVKQVEIEEMFEEVIQLIDTSDFNEELKIITIASLTNKVDFIEYAKSIGKSKQWAELNYKRVQMLIQSKIKLNLN